MYSQYSSVIKFLELPSPDDYLEIQEKIGNGTYGDVYSAIDKETGEKVAVKILECIHEIIEEVEEEYLILRDFGGCCNIPKFCGLYLKRHGTNPEEDQLWMAMELCSGGAISDIVKHLLRHGHHLSEDLIGHILKQTMIAINYLHDNHIIHRDIKGYNILLTEDADIKLVDFGVSGHLSSPLAKRKTSVGTPFWMAPEVIACEQQLDSSYDIRCDVWSLGITAIELADGDPPHSELHPMRVLFKIPRSPPPTVQQPELWSDDFLDFISCCVIKDFTNRPFIRDLLQHPFIRQVPRDTAGAKAELKSLISETERTIHEPEITTKHGRLKSKPISRKSTMKTVDDLATLENLEEDVIVDHLFHRYTQGQIYTYIGDILLAVNPFKPLTVYSDQYAQTYMNAAKKDNPPHIYGVADQSYQAMMHNKHNQCIVISGESGSGKTESANFMVQQLTLLGKAPNRTLEEKILQVNPLLEAFGNAQTVINDNSSRFGKYLEMVFTPTGKVIGAKLSEYLLEKSRVIHQSGGEKNFHILYYIHDGLPVLDKQHKYHLDPNTQFRYLNGYTPSDVATVSINRVRFKTIEHCFEIIGFKSQEVTSIHCVLASILHIGNIQFCVAEKEFQNQSSNVANPQLLDIVSELLGIDPNELLEALTTSGMVARGEVIVRHNSVAEAVNVRDAMAKALYGRLFSWLVNRINTLLKPAQAGDKNHHLSVGLLDIFGFENFPSNSFEQLCINIANEQIQYYFNQHIFAWEMQEYKNEGIDGSQINFVDNRPVLDMFLAKPLGLLALLDEESNFPKATDQTLVEKFHQNIKASHYSKPKGDNPMFAVEHYAGRVEYDVHGFLQKNRDWLAPETLNLLRQSELSLVRTIFQSSLTKTGHLSSGNSTPNTLERPKGSSTFTDSLSSNSSILSIKSGSRPSSVNASKNKIQQTVSTYFRYSLMDLLSKMVAGTPHFVRCIRPNTCKQPGYFDPEKVRIQLQYTGVLETTKIRRQGFSNRIPFADFMARYYVLGFNWKERKVVNRENCKLLLQRCGLKNWAVGKTKVFLKYYHMEQLARRYEEHIRHIVKAQAQVRMYLAREKYLRTRWDRQRSALLIQKVFRGWLIRKRFHRERAQKRRAAIVIQTAWRGHHVRKKQRPEIERRRKAAVRIQSFVRTYLQKRNYVKYRALTHSSAIKIQTAFRGFFARKLVKHMSVDRKERLTRSAIVIQKYFRRWREMSRYQQMLSYKSQKEIQLIYFGQQVEMHSNDMFRVLQRNNMAVTATMLQEQQQQRLQQQQMREELQRQQQQRQLQQQQIHYQQLQQHHRPQQVPAFSATVSVQPRAPVSPPPPPPPPMPLPEQVGEERVEQVGRMRTHKVPWGGCLQYYDKLTEQRRVIQTSSDDARRSKRHLKEVTPNDSSGAYYDSIVQQIQTRSEKKIFASKNRDSGSWDQPLEEARRRALSSEDIPNKLTTSLTTCSSLTSPLTPITPLASCLTSPLSPCISTIPSSPGSSLTPLSSPSDYNILHVPGTDIMADSETEQEKLEPELSELDEMFRKILATTAATKLIAQSVSNCHCCSSFFQFCNLSVVISVIYFGCFGADFEDRVNKSFFVCVCLHNIMSNVLVL
ncbi:myosin-IIIb isoform X2 [Lingula anatina]|uniref:non-specific serine/threonine protein kinase n=1 Tax=Lingula anatina TaxID=7574 RepID=A0A1S3JL48_LINAN|nr:myosin-IIIb isoform X2 [Lingula anatina]|eukprot:XP_013411135.1 myosin-IIIb isoform X2 [Lingula anatina]